MDYQQGRLAYPDDPAGYSPGSQAAYVDRPAPSQYYGIGTQGPDLEGSRFGASPTVPSERDPLNDSSQSQGNGKKLVVITQESVYSAILFLPAISRLKTGKETNRGARLALFLVLVNAVLQTGMVQVINIYDHVYRRADVQELLHPHQVAFSSHDEESSKAVAEAYGDAHKSVLLPNEKKELHIVENISPLCERRQDGMLSCMPRSVGFVHEWNSLDTNGDGVWTFEEAQADAAKLKERHGGVAPATIFNNLINGLRMSRMFEEHRGRNRTLYLTADVDNERNIPKAYFNYWIGDAMMCSFFDSNSCEGVAMDGVFAEALRPGRVSADAKGIYDLDSAIQYCDRMLSPGGGCEALLPTDFKRNREQRWGRCGDRSLVEGGKYTNPYNPDQSVQVLRATYGSVDDYQTATSRLYLTFMCMIIMLWFYALVDEFRELIKFGEFLMVYPGIKPGTAGGEVLGKDEDEVAYKITALSRKHRAVLIAVYVMRLAVAVMVLMLGTRFLLSETNYLSLVLNSLVLTFVLEIDSILYTLIDQKTGIEIDRANKLKFRTRLPTDGVLGYCLRKECWGLFLIPTVAVFIVLYFNFRDKEPILEALTCACNQEGSKCLDSMTYQGSWWTNYWSRVLPSAMHQIEALRLAGE